MNPVFFAMKHPITTLMLVVGLVCGGTMALSRMRVDIFPPLNEPQIYVFLNFNGMSPAQMEGLIVNQFELNFQYVDGVKEIESHSIQQIALVKLSFYPGHRHGPGRWRSRRQGESRACRACRRVCCRRRSCAWMPAACRSAIWY